MVGATIVRHPARGAVRHLGREARVDLCRQMRPVLFGRSDWQDHDRVPLRKRGDLRRLQPRPFDLCHVRLLSDSGRREQSVDPGAK
jgi:hypothetical protein